MLWCINPQYDMILRAYKVHGLPLTRDAVTSLSHSALSPPQPASNCALPSMQERAKAQQYCGGQTTYWQTPDFKILKQSQHSTL